MIDIHRPAAQWSRAEIEDMYKTLLASGDDKRTAKLPVKWNPSEFQTASAYAVRVAQNSTLDEFVTFIHTGEPAHPVKMTPAEMELVQGGSRATDWIIAAGAVAVAAGSACCA
ncbi:MAG TPA: hypothetical protein VGF94_02010 [Kofleriaceae bacterium]|jgi:hypothetical protein